MYFLDIPEQEKAQSLCIFADIPQQEKAQSLCIFATYLSTPSEPEVFQMSTPSEHTSANIYVSPKNRRGRCRGVTSPDALLHAYTVDAVHRNHRPPPATLTAAAACNDHPPHHTPPTKKKGSGWDDLRVSLTDLEYL